MIVLNINLVLIPGRIVSITLITRKRTRGVAKVTRTVLTRARVIRAVVHMARTPAVRMRITSKIVKKKEKSP